MLRYKLVFISMLALGYPFGSMGQGISCIDSGKFLNAENMQWIRFVKKFKNRMDTTMGNINIIQIGDSHIQGGYFPNQVRKLLELNNIKTSIGLTFPHSLAGTNGSELIHYYSPNRWISESTVHPGADKLSVMGYRIFSRDSVIELTVKFKDITDSSWINRIRIFHNTENCRAFCDKTTQIEAGRMNDSVFFTDFILSVPSDSVRFQMIPCKKTAGWFQLFSLEMETFSADITYHALGINGVSYEKYLARIDYMPWLKQIKPDCLVLSFGTNDTYSGVINEKAFTQNISNLIDTLKMAFPEMAIIITSPGDHLRYKKYTNRAISNAARYMHEVAIKKDCLFWDFFSAMGGEGSSRQWFTKGWMYRDFVHLSKDGYKQQGEMFFNAFINTIEETWQNELQRVNCL